MALAKRATPKKDDAKAFLIEILDGSEGVPAEDVKDRAKQRGISMGTLRLAVEEIVDANPKKASGARRATSHWRLKKPPRKTTARSENAAYERGFEQAIHLAEHAALRVIDQQDLPKPRKIRLIADMRVALNVIEPNFRHKQLK